MYALITLLCAVGLIASVACAPLSYLNRTSRAKAQNTPAKNKSTDDARKQICTKDCEYKIVGKSTPTINSAMQKKFLTDFLKNKRYHFAYALFSYSGWSDAGQIMILTDKKGNGRLIYYPPNKTNYSTTITFSSKRFLVDLMPKFKLFSSLPDYTPKVLDGLEYEYLRAERLNPTTAVVHDRVYMRVPHTSKNPQYRLLISSFKKFKDSLLPVKKKPTTL